MNNSRSNLWKPVEGKIMTRWAKDVTENPLSEYPRPQLKRNKWKNLNGLWDYAIRPKTNKLIDIFDGKILVPFPIEAALSGVKKKLMPSKRLWYRRYFTIPESWKDKDLLLHFGGVDWETTIWVNGKEIGSHKGGYVPFYFEISEYIQEGENELIVAVWDPTNYERGKQTLRPFLIYYTAVSGIWQTVWLEPVFKTHISSLQMVPNIDEKSLELKVNINNIESNDIINVEVKDNGNNIITTSGKSTIFNLDITNPKLWSPDSPFLYDIIINITRNGEIIDEVESYCGMRKIEVGKDKDGIPRILLNNKQIFQYGTLDQGYWPDGLYTAPTDEALKFDIEITKEIGFNMIRKHVKVEPARWYYYCDKLGILVWQDMPNGGNWIIFGRGKKSRIYYFNELKAMISSLYNYPSIIVWVPFNEGWGQFKTSETVEIINNIDNTRLIDAASGWFDKKVGDIKDIHKYPGPRIPKIEEERAAVLGEFGGLGFEIKDHIWKKSKLNWSYKKSSNQEKLTRKYDKLITKLKPLIKEGLCAAIYTQTTDVEAEVNGLLTYDREIIKIDKEKLKEINSIPFDS